MFDNNYGYRTFLGLSFGMEVGVVMMNNCANLYDIIRTRFGIKGTNLNNAETGNFLCSPADLLVILQLL